GRKVSRGHGARVSMTHTRKQAVCPNQVADLIEVYMLRTVRACAGMCKTFAQFCASRTTRGALSSSRPHLVPSSKTKRFPRIFAPVPSGEARTGKAKPTLRLAGHRFCPSRQRRRVSMKTANPFQKLIANLGNVRELSKEELAATSGGWDVDLGVGPG